MMSVSRTRPLLSPEGAPPPIRLSPEMEASRSLAADSAEDLDVRLEAY